MSKSTDAEVHDLIESKYDVNTRSLEFKTVSDQREALKHDLTRIKASPYLPGDLTVGGALYDVHTGRITPIDL
jgi:carbonic anhydrase